MKQRPGMIYGIAMTIIWSVVFTIALKSWVGIGIGVLFGVSFGISDKVATEHTKNKIQAEQEKQEKPKQE